MIHGILIDTTKHEIRPYSLKHNTLDEYYKACKCDYVEIVNRMFNNIPCSIICDEEGLLHSIKPPVAIITTNGNNNKVIEEIVGDCFICGIDMKSLTDEQVKSIIDKCSIGGVLKCNI